MTTESTKVDPVTEPEVPGTPDGQGEGNGHPTTQPVVKPMTQGEGNRPV
jgi:hypothetical protein